MRSCPETVEEIMDILNTYGDVRSRVDTMGEYTEGFIYCLYYKDGVLHASGDTRLTAVKSLYRKTYEKMFYVGLILKPISL